MRRATSSGSSSCGKCRAPGTRNSSDVGNFSWKSRATPTFRYGSASPKNYPHRTPESSHLGLRTCAGPHGPPQIGVQREERRLGTRRRGELLVEERHELLSHFLIPDEPPPDLPPVHPAEEVEPARYEPRYVPQEGRGEQQDRLRRPRRRREPVVSVQ